MSSLEGQLLIAMPGMADPNFNETVTYICKHDADGAIGIVVNRASDVTLGEICEQLSLEGELGEAASQLIMNGGPVHTDRGFVLHQSDQVFDSTFDADAEVKVTVSQDILKSIARGDGPEPALVALGYAGWGSGQLESEIAANAWLSVPAAPAILFDTPIDERWQAAAALIGIDIRQVTSYAGHA
ncbi:MAG TPA: YqgE/AlgH family protein [Gammaproteobacteria bacterium]|jgi:putative transcriptional regulator